MSTAIVGPSTSAHAHYWSFRPLNVFGTAPFVPFRVQQQEQAVGRLPRLERMENRARQPVLWVPPTAPAWTQSNAPERGHRQRGRSAERHVRCARDLLPRSALAGMRYAASRRSGARLFCVPLG
jgi:hypothetical protein